MVDNKGEGAWFSQHRDPVGPFETGYIDIQWVRAVFGGLVMLYYRDYVERLWIERVEWTDVELSTKPQTVTLQAADLVDVEVRACIGCGLMNRVLIVIKQFQERRRKGHSSAQAIMDTQNPKRPDSKSRLIPKPCGLTHDHPTQKPCLQPSDLNPKLPKPHRPLIKGQQSLWVPLGVPRLVWESVCAVTMAMDRSQLLWDGVAPQSSSMFLAMYPEAGDFRVAAPI